MVHALCACLCRGALCCVLCGGATRVPVAAHVIPRRVAGRTGGADARVKVAAKEIAKSLNMTAQLVGQLKGLVQRRSLFNDHAHSINENAAAVKKNISHLRAQLSALVKLVASRGGTEGVRDPLPVRCCCHCWTRAASHRASPIVAGGVCAGRAARIGSKCRNC